MVEQIDRQTDVATERMKSHSPLREAPSPSSERPPAVLEFPAETKKKTPAFRGLYCKMNTHHFSLLYGTGNRFTAHNKHLKFPQKHSHSDTFE